MAASPESHSNPEFIAQSVEILKANFETFNSGLLDTQEGQNAIFRNNTFLLFLVFLMDNKDPELNDLLIDILDAMCRHARGADALLKTCCFKKAFAEFAQANIERKPECAGKLERISKAIEKRGRKLEEKPTPKMDLSKHKIEKQASGVKVTQPKVATPLRFINSKATKARLIVLQIDGLINPEDRDDVKKALVAIPGVVSIYFISKDSDRVNVRALQHVSPAQLGDAVSSAGPFVCSLVLKRQDSQDDENCEEIIPLEHNAGNWKDSYLPDETRAVVDNMAPAPSAGAGIGPSVVNTAASWISSATSFIRRPFW